MSSVYDPENPLPWQYWNYPRESQVLRNADALQRANADLIRELRIFNVTMPISVADMLHRAEHLGWLAKEQLDLTAADGREWKRLIGKIIERGECP